MARYNFISQCLTFLCIRVLRFYRFANIAVIPIQLSNVTLWLVVFSKDVGLNAYIYSPVVFKCLMLIDITDISIIYNDQLTNL